MFIENLLNQGNSPLLEQTLRFTEARARLLTEDVSNASTPNYQQKDLDVAKFQSMLRDRVDRRDSDAPGATTFDDINGELSNSKSLLYHDGNNRSMEQLMSDNAKNAMFHNLVVEVLRKQYATMTMALTEKAS